MFAVTVTGDAYHCPTVPTTVITSIIHAALFIDCAKDGALGDFCREEVHWQTGSVSFTHDLSPKALLDLASPLFGSCPRAFLLTICGECFATGEALSPCVSRQIPKLKERVRELTAESLADIALTR